MIENSRKQEKRRAEKKEIDSGGDLVVYEAHFITTGGCISIFNIQ
jgi:hypothetical protein